MIIAAVVSYTQERGAHLLDHRSSGPTEFSVNPMLLEVSSWFLLKPMSNDFPNYVNLAISRT